MHLICRTRNSIQVKQRFESVSPPPVANHWFVHIYDELKSQCNTCRMRDAYERAYGSNEKSRNLHWRSVAAPQPAPPPTRPESALTAPACSEWTGWAATSWTPSRWGRRSPAWDDPSCCHSLPGQHTSTSGTRQGHAYESNPGPRPKKDLCWSQTLSKFTESVKAFCLCGEAKWSKSTKNASTHVNSIWAGIQSECRLALKACPTPGGWCPGFCGSAWRGLARLGLQHTHRRAQVSQGREKYFTKRRNIFQLNLT